MVIFPLCYSFYVHLCKQHKHNQPFLYRFPKGRVTLLEKDNRPLLVYFQQSQTYRNELLVFLLLRVLCLLSKDAHLSTPLMDFAKTCNKSCQKTICQFHRFPLLPYRFLCWCKPHHRNSKNLYNRLLPFRCLGNS